MPGPSGAGLPDRRRRCRRGGLCRFPELCRPGRFARRQCAGAAGMLSWLTRGKERQTENMKRGALTHPLVLACVTAVAVMRPAAAAPFTPGNLVVSRIGGTQDDLMNFPDAASRIRLLEINPADGSIIQEVPL